MSTGLTGESPMRVLIFEHLCGGALADNQLPAELARSGLAMWRAVIKDFAAAGHDVVTTLDHRLTRHALDVPTTIVQERDQLPNTIRTLADTCDAALVIAPESDSALLHWFDLLAQTPCRWLGCARDVIDLCGDKLRLAQDWQEAGVPTPPLCGKDSDRRFDSTNDISPRSKWIIKPRFGVGCENTLISRELPINHAPVKGEDSIIQPYVEGIAASVSFLVHNDSAIALPPGRQLIETDEQLTYCGGELPLTVNLATRAVAIARRAISAVAGLHGYVGVDVILADDPAHDVAIEINPRLTMSYVGLRQLCKTNLAAAMLDDHTPLEWFSGIVRFDPAGRLQSTIDRAQDVAP